jgi:hypothetical protein
MALEISQQPLCTSAINQLVRNYLYHFGYADTLQSFELSLGLPPAELLHKEHQHSLRRRAGIVFDVVVVEVVMLVYWL